MSATSGDEDQFVASVARIALPGGADSEVGCARREASSDEGYWAGWVARARVDINKSHRTMMMDRGAPERLNISESA